MGHVDDEVPPSKRAKAPTKKKVEPVEGRNKLCINYLIFHAKCMYGHSPFLCYAEYSLSHCLCLQTETDRAGDPVVVETHQSKTKQIKKTKTTTRTDHNTIKDVASNLAPISHPSHGSRPGQASHCAAHVNGCV